MKKTQIKQADLIRAVGYMRTSSINNVGPDKDSERRQHKAIEHYAEQSGYMIEQYCYDSGVSGTDNVITRPAFNEMVTFIQTNNIKTVIIESADRLARDLMIQLMAHDLLKRMGVTLIAANAPEHFMNETPTAVMFRQILGSLAQYERTQIIARLSAARDRKRALTGRCGGNLGIKHHDAAGTAMAQRLSRKRKQRLSLYEISTQLAAAGFISKSGKQYSASTISAMIKAT